jgi:hypothetical protein
MASCPEHGIEAPARFEIEDTLAAVSTAFVRDFREAVALLADLQRDVFCDDDDLGRTA